MASVQAKLGAGARVKEVHNTSPAAVLNFCPVAALASVALDVVLNSSIKYWAPNTHVCSFDHVGR